MTRLENKVSRRTLLRGAVAGAAGAGALAVVGCGDDGDPAPTATSAPPTVTGAQPTTGASASGTNAVGTWRQIETTGGPSPRRDHSLTLNADDGLIYLFGGRAAGNANDELWTFDTRAQVWKQIDAGGPPNRFGHNAVYDRAGKRLVVTLGQNEDGFFNDVWAFADGSWKQLHTRGDDKPQIRYGAGAAHDETKNVLWISHGFTDEGRFDDTWMFDLSDDTWKKLSTSGTVPIKRCLTRCLWLSAPQQMLLFGGQTDDTPFLGDEWRLDTTKGTWQQQQPARAPGPRNLYGATLDADGGRWFVVTGNTPDGPTQETWIYDIASDRWSLAPTSGTAISARYSADAALGGTTLYVFGGLGGDAELGDMWGLEVGS